MSKQLDKFFGPKEKRPRHVGCPICGETNEIVIQVQAYKAQGLKRTGESKTKSLSFCATHGIETWQELVAVLEDYRKKSQ